MGAHRGEGGGVQLLALGGGGSCPFGIRHGGKGGEDGQKGKLYSFLFNWAEASHFDLLSLLLLLCLMDLCETLSSPLQSMHVCMCVHACVHACV